MTQKIVINVKHGGFELSHAAFLKYHEYSGKQVFYKEDDIWGFAYYSSPNMEDESYISRYDIPRDDPNLVRVVMEMGEDANTTFSELKVVEIPDGVEWDICEFDGLEHIAEKHRTWQ